MTCSLDPFDVGVIGGGPAGATAATILARSGLRVLLVDDSRSSEFKVGEGLPPAAKPLLCDVGVWERFAADGHLRSCGNESAWGGPEVRSTHFLRDPNGHGWHLDRARFDQTLRETAISAGARVRLPIRTRVIGQSRRGWLLALEANSCRSHARATWLIDCTGRRSLVARLRGAPRVRNDRLVAWIARFAVRTDPCEDVDSTTLVESAPHGWWYTALVPSRQRVVVYLTDSNDPTGRQARTTEGFEQLLDYSGHIRARLRAHGYQITSRPTVVAADSSRLVQVTGDGWTAAGDAAVSFDPLSSQGIFTAIYSGMRAAQAVAARLGGDPHPLVEYGTRIEAVYAAYLEHWRQSYGYERRWPRHEFWRSRHEVRAAART